MDVLQESRMFDEPRTRFNQTATTCWPCLLFSSCLSPWCRHWLCNDAMVPPSEQTFNYWYCRNSLSGDSERSSNIDLCTDEIGSATNWVQHAWSYIELADILPMQQNIHFAHRLTWIDTLDNEYHITQNITHILISHKPRRMVVHLCLLFDVCLSLFILPSSTGQIVWFSDISSKRGRWRPREALHAPLHLQPGSRDGLGTPFWDRNFNYSNALEHFQFPYLGKGAKIRSEY